MAEAVGISLGVTSLVLELYTKISNSARDFHHLDQDLKCFHGTLERHEHYLDRLDDIRIACEELAAEIRKLISKYESRNRLRRVGLALQDVEPLRMRMAFQISMLNASVNTLKEHDVASSRQTQLRSVRSRPLLSLRRNDNHNLRNDYKVSAERRTGSLSPVYLETSLSLASTLDTDSNVLSSPSSTVSLISTNTSQSVLSMRDLPSRCSSINSVQRGGSSQLSPPSLGGTDTTGPHTPLTEAIVAGEDHLVQQWIDIPIFVEARDKIWDWTPAIWAVVENRPTILEALIQKGADLIAADGILQRTPLLWGASVGHQPIVELLLRHNRDLIHARDNEGMSPLALACIEDHIETARLLLMNGDNPNFVLASQSSLLAWTMSRANEQLASLLLNHGANPRCDADGVPALILAMRHHQPSLAELLISKGAMVQCTDENGVPALIVAVKGELSDIAELLIVNGADVGAKDPEGNPALLWAIWHENVRVVEKMVQNNTNTAAVDGEGVSLQNWAARVGNEAIIQLLTSRECG